MPAPLLRRGLWALGFAAVALAVFIVVLPYAASNQIVRDRIAQNLSAWSGFQVSIGATPEIEIWPSFRAILTDVTLSPWNASGASVIDAERVEIELSALAALRGDVVFSSLRLIRPTLRVEQSASGLYLPALPGGGRVARAVATARGIVEENRASPDTRRLPEDAFGTLEFVDGRIVAASAEPGADEIVTNLTGKVNWAALNRPGTITAAGVWRGEDIAIDITSSSPLLLLGGGAARLSVTLSSEPASFLFDGTANLMDNAYFDGRAKFTATSLRRTIEWSHSGMSAGSAIGSVSIESQVAGNAQRVKFEDAQIALDGNPGRGFLDLSLTGKLPIVSGTLAFDSLDLLSFLSAFTPLETAAGRGPGAIDASFADRINLDLRLSAEKATVGSVSLTGVAATARVNEGFAAFDISDAAAFGGTIQAGMRFDRKAEETHVEMRLLASDIDGGAFGAAAGMTRLVPVGNGTISVILKGPGSAWATILENASGSISASFGPGALSGFDLKSFLERTQEGGFFALDDVSKGALPIDALEFKASVSDGVATIERAEAKSARTRILLSGIVPYVGRGLALSGTIEPADRATAGTGVSATTKFFVGGSWSAPFISPLPKAIPDKAIPVE